MLALDMPCLWPPRLNCIRRALPGAPDRGCRYRSTPRSCTC